MKKLIVYYGDSPVQVEGFSKDCQRSVEGAIHMLPGKPKTVTDDEFQHMQEKYGWMKPKLRVVANLTAEQVKAAEAAKAKAKKVAEAKPEAKTEKKPEVKAEPKAEVKPKADAGKDSTENGGKKDFKKRK